MLEDEMILNELLRRDLQVKKVAWSDSTFEWSTTKYALFRSTWDYAERLEEFDNWLKGVSTKTTLINSHRLIFMEFKTSIIYRIWKPWAVFMW